MTSFQPIKIFDGFVHLVQHSENPDLAVANSARVSFGKRVTELSEGDIKLIGFLMRERHGTPFEHNFFSFHIKCPIFVAREWFRHRISSFNEFSMRYSSFSPEFFIPSPEDVRTQVGKPGAYHFEPHPDQIVVLEWIAMVEQLCEKAEAIYKWALDNGIAKEQARIILPVNTYTEFYWSVNARSLMNFLSLRNDNHAMKEIRDFAMAIELMFGKVMPHTRNAFVECNRIAI